MTQSLELVLDEASDAAVRQLWHELRDAGLPSMADHGSETNRPHVTLGVAQLVPDDAEQSLPALADAVPLELRLGAPIVFGGRGGRGGQGGQGGRGEHILCLSVTPSRQLLDLQARAAEHLAGLPTSAPHMRPGEWTPHVTVARKLSTSDLAKAIDVLGGRTELVVTAVALRRWNSDARHTWLLG